MVMPKVLNITANITEITIGEIKIESNGTIIGSKVLFDGKEQKGIERIVVDIDAYDDNRPVKIMAFLSPAPVK